MEKKSNSPNGLEQVLYATNTVDSTKLQNTAKSLPETLSQEVIFEKTCEALLQQGEQINVYDSDHIEDLISKVKTKSVDV